MEENNDVPKSLGEEIQRMAQRADGGGVTGQSTFLPWDKLPESNKIERLRHEVKGLIHRLERTNDELREAEQLISQLRYHNHTHDGDVVIPIRLAMQPERLTMRSPSSEKDRYL